MKHLQINLTNEVEDFTGKYKPLLKDIKVLAEWIDTACATLSHDWLRF